MFPTKVGESTGDSCRDMPSLLCLPVGVTGLIRSVFGVVVVVVVLWLRTGDEEVLWSGDFSLMGWRALEKREKLGDLAGDAGSFEDSRETFVRRGPAGLLTDD